MAPRQSAAQQSQFLDEHHQRISEFASEYFDDDEEREAFVDTLLERRGYQRTAGWSLPPEPDPAAAPPAAGGAGTVVPPAGPKRAAYFRK